MDGAILLGQALASAHMLSVSADRVRGVRVPREGELAVSVESCVTSEKPCEITDILTARQIEKVEFSGREREPITNGENAVAGDVSPF